MPYAVRDETNKIVGLYLKNPGVKADYIEIDHPEVIDFLTEAGHKGTAQSLLEDYDYSVLRVLEDLIIILIRHNIFDFNEFPKNAQDKLMSRESLRRILDNATHMQPGKPKASQQADDSKS